MLVAAGALLALTLTATDSRTVVAQTAPTVTGVAVTSVAGSDQTYALGESIRVTLTFSEAVTVTGSPRLAIDMDPADWGKKWATYEDGTGTASVTFVHTVVQPNYSTQGIAVLANTLELQGGSIRSASSGVDATLTHTGLNHDPDHKVDWRRNTVSRTEPGASAAPGAPAISSATAALTSVTVVWTAPSSDGGSSITAYDLRYIRSDAQDKSDSHWTVQEDVWETGGGALSYAQTGLTPSTGYDFQVRAVNADGDGAWSATQTATTESPAISGTAALSYAENSATRVGTFTVAGAEPDDVTWTITGTDASHFHINEPKGALRLIDTSDTATGLKRPKMPDFESPDDSGADKSYSITVSATVGGVAATKAVTVTVTDVNEPGSIAIAPVRPNVRTALTATLSDQDTVSGTTTWVWQRSSGRNSWTAISGATSASYTPVAADSGQYLRVKATYTDRHGANQSAEATAHHVVIASELTGLAVRTSANVPALKPAFQSDVLHYKIRCKDEDTLTITPRAADGVRLAINGTQTTSGTAVDVSVTKDSDVVVRSSGADGGFTDYVVHCAQGYISYMSVTEEQAGEATEELISWGFGDYLVIVDNRGVPRYRYDLSDTHGTPRFWFRFSRVGSNGEYRWSYGVRPDTESPGTQYVLDEDFEHFATVRHASPLTNTGIHDFRPLSNGNYLLMSYENRTWRDLSAYGYDLDSLVIQNPSREWLDGSRALMQDSGIQIVSPSRSAIFSWKSWGKLPYEDCTQHWGDLYAHVNMVYYFEGSVIASFRGCSKVMSISTTTGKTEWSIGRTNLEPGEWESRGLGPEPLTIIGDPEGEICGQHGAEMHPGNRLTLFDNGEHCVVDPLTRESVRESDLYARAVEYAIDTENGEAVFLWAKDQNDTKTLSGTRGGHVVVLDNGDWLISWARERRSPKVGYGNVEKAITQVDPRTGTRKLAFDIVSPTDASVQANIRATTVPAYALAPQPVALSGHAPASERTSLFHTGDDDTPKVLLTFNRPVVDFATSSPSLSVTGGTITDVSALTANGEPANAYLVTLDPSGAADVRLSVLANKACADGGICTADGTKLTKTPAAIVITAAPQVSFHQATFGGRENNSTGLLVRLSRAHQGTRGVTIPIVLNSAKSTASQDDYQLDGRSVTFQRGETSKTLGIRLLTDTLVEGPETLVFGFGTLPDDVGLGTPSSLTFTITDSTQPVISYSRIEGELAEGASDSFTLEITNSVTFAKGAAINLAVSGSAGAGDFSLEDASGSTLSAPYSITLPAGQSSTSFTVRATDDNDSEPTDETVTITATLALTNASLGSRSATIPPSDVPNVPDVTTSANGDVQEGEAASFTLQRSGATTAALSVTVRAVATGVSLRGSAPSSVTFAAGSASATLNLPTRDDTIVRNSGGQVQVYLIGSSSNPPTYLTTPANRATVIVNEDDEPEWSVTASAEELIEGQTLRVTVDTGGVTFPANQIVELTLRGSATPGEDYVLPSVCSGSTCSLTLRTGARSVAVNLYTLYDGETDDDETIDVVARHNGSDLGSVSVNVEDRISPLPVFDPGNGGGGAPSGGGGGGGGGFGPPPPPKPSDVDLEWSVTADIEELVDGHTAATGAWGSSDALWLLHNGPSGPDRLYAYAADSGEPLSELGFELDALNRSAQGLWSDGDTVWISDSGEDRLFAYLLQTGERAETRDLVLHEDNGDPRGVWSDGRQVYVVNRAENRSELFSYRFDTGELVDRYALDRIINREPHGVWSDGVFIWVADSRSNRVQAYRISDGALEKVESQTIGFRTLIAASNSEPRGIWSNGDLLFVVDADDDKVYSYNLPDAGQAWLRSLAIAGLDIGSFSPLCTTYDGAADDGLAEVTVDAVPTQTNASVAIEPADADGDPANGHQVAIEDGLEIVITVTSEDESRERIYAITVQHLNRAPLSEEIPPLSLAAGGEPIQLALDDYFSDPDGDSLAYAVSEPADVGVVRLSQADGVLTITPLRAGATSFELSASDGQLASERQPVSVTVEAAVQQTTDEPAEVSVPEVMIAARHVDGGQVEFALQVRAQDESWQERILPQRRFLQADAATGAWRVSSAIAVEADGSARTVRIGARRLDAGGVEFALLVRLEEGGWSAQLLPMNRFLPRDAEPGRWRYSSPLLPEAP